MASSPQAYMAYLQSINGAGPQPEGDLFIADFGARGWNPTQPDEQLLATSGAPSSSFSVAAAAPWASPEMHDVDFWNGWLNKRNGRIQVGANVGPAPILGVFKYVFAQATGALTKFLVAACNSTLGVFSNGAWDITHSMFGWQNALYAFFVTIQNQMVVFAGNNPANAPVAPLWWDGSSVNLGYLGNRISPYYLAKSGSQNYYAVQIQTVTAGASGQGPTLTIAPNQAASGLYLGMAIYIDNGNYFESATVADFATTGTAGTANYYVTSITLSLALRYSTQNYTRASWNGVNISVASTGGSITTASTATTILIMAVTNLNSGGQRATIYSCDVPNGSTGLITLQNLNFAGGDGQLFGSDLSQTATQWFMTQPFNPQIQAASAGSGPSQIFYQIPSTPGSATNITSTDGVNDFPGQNPPPNTAISIEILNSPDTGSWLTAQGALALDSQGYLTGQIDAPACQFGVAWQGFLAAAGDPLNPSRLYLTAYGAPQIWGTQGGLDGAYIDIPDFWDGQVITGLWVGRNGLLYVHKTNSLYAVNFTGNTSLSPFQVQTCTGNFGALSPFLIEESDQGIFFLSASGIVGVNSYTAELLPQNAAIRAKLTGLLAYDFAAMGAAQAFTNPTKTQFHFQAAAANLGDQTLVFDWSKNTFWHNTPGPTATPAQCYTSLCEDLTTAPVAIYGGDGQGNVWQLDQPGLDETVPIDFYYETPWLHAGDSGQWKQLLWLAVAGQKQSAANGTPFLNAVIYLDFDPKAARTFPIDMSQDGFEIGLNDGTNPLSMNLRCRYFKVALMNNQPGVQVSIRFMRIRIRLEGNQL